MAPRRGRESNQGLVIALVFAVLIILGLGVTAYMQGNAKTEALQKEKKARDDVEVMKKDRDWFKFQALLYRAYMGQTEGVDFGDLGALKSQFDGGSLGTGASDKEGVTKLVKDQDARMPWDATQNRPRNTYESLLTFEKQKREAAEKMSADYQAAADASAKAAKKATDQLKDERASFDQKLAELNRKSAEDMSGYIKTIESLRAEIARLGGQKEDVVKTASAERKQFEEQLAKKQNKEKGLLEQLDQKRSVIEDLKSKGVGTAPKGWQNEWKIVSIGKSGKTVYLNLGSADHVTPQLTFSIHSVGPDGGPVPVSKGSVEVVRVESAHLSQAQVLTVKDPDRDPIVAGDILYNPTWRPTLKKHVALVGVIDLTGDGRDSTYELIRNLDRQNVVVDAYVDPREKVIKGPGITVQTDFLIVGSSPREITGEGHEAQKDAQRRQEAEEAKLVKQAKENGVQQINLRDYLESIGYRLPQTPVELAKPEAAEPTPVAPKKAEKPPAETAPAEEKPGEEKPK